MSNNNQNNKNARKQLRKRTKNRSSKGTFIMLPHAVMDSAAFISLSNKAVKCLLDILRPFNGKNNGDLSCTISVMRERGWTSKNQLDLARNELLRKGLIVITRQGGRNKCSLYAVTWLPIDECNGKLDRKPTNVALGYWKQGMNPELKEAA
jgi:hypothetical protein